MKESLHVQRQIETGILLTLVKRQMLTQEQYMECQKWISTVKKKECHDEENSSLL